MQAAWQGVAVQQLKTAYHDYLHGIERDKRIGLKIAGHDVPSIDREIKEFYGIDEGEDVDSSVRISGDTHIHVGKVEDIPKIVHEPGEPTKIIPTENDTPPPQPQPTPTPPPQPQQPTNRMPTWAKWALGAAIAGNAVGIPAAAYFSKDSTTVITPPDRSTIGLTIE